MLVDDFTGYTIGNLAGQGGWTKSGSGPDATVANTTLLTIANYNGGGAEYVVMPAASATSSRVYKAFTSTAGGTNTFYYSALIRLTSVSFSSVGYFLSLGDPSPGTGYFARLFAQTSGSGFNIGISKGSNTPTWGTTVYNLNQTYLVIVRYDYVTGATNDPIYVWMFSSTPSSEPTTGSADATISSGTDGPANVGNIIWHNRGLTNAVGSFDGVRVAYGSTSSVAWTNLNAYVPSSGLYPPTGISIPFIANNKMNIAWNKPAGIHGTDWDGVVFFVSKDATNTATVTGSPGTYTANLAYGSGTPSGNAYCVANQSTDVNGDIVVTGLTEGSTYYVIGYTYKNPSTWSVVSTPEVSDQAEVQGVASFTAASGNTVADLAWVNYAGAQGTWWDEVMIVGKAGSAVSATPSGNGSTYTANETFGSGTDLGSGNYVVYKGTGTSVTVNTLAIGTTYYFRAFVRYGTAWTDADLYKDAIITPYAEYRSAATGDWNLAATWEVYNGSGWIAATDAPFHATKNVTVQSGHTVKLVDNNGKCKNLTIDLGGRLYANAASANNAKYLYVYGDITDNGVIGSNDNGTTPDLIGFDIEGATCLIDGNGVFDAGRISKFTETNLTTSMTLNMNVILRYPTISTDALYNYKSVTTTFNIIVNPAVLLNVTLAKINLTGCTLTLKSDATGTACLLDNGTITGNTTANASVERYLTNGSTNSEWHIVSSPVSDATSNIFLGDYLMQFNESTHAFEYVTSTSAPLTPVKGFFTWVNSTSTKVFSGTLNTGNKSIGVTRTYDAGTSDYYGWNLVGNPYPSFLDLTTSMIPWVNVDQAAWFWDKSAGNYTVYPTQGPGYGTHTAYAPPEQGFFVHCNDATATPSTPGSGTVSFTNSARTYSTEPFLKNNAVIPNLLKIQAQGFANGYNDALTVYFDPSRSNQYEAGYDALKYSGNADAPQIYTKINDKAVSVNALVFDQTNITVPMGFYIDTPANYTLIADNLGSFEDAISIRLEDLKLNVTQDLRINPVYNFTYAVADNPDRFVLHFDDPTLGGQEKAKDNAVKIYSHENIIYIDALNGNTLNGTVYVIDLLGKELLHQALPEQQHAKISTRLTEGYYLVKVVTDKGVYTGKVYLNW